MFLLVRRTAMSLLMIIGTMAIVAALTLKGRRSHR